MLEKHKKLTKLKKNFSIGKMLTFLMLFSPTLSFAVGKEAEIFIPPKNAF